MVETEICELERGLLNAASALVQYLENGQTEYAELPTQKIPGGWTFLEKNCTASYSIGGEKLELLATVRNPSIDTDNRDLRPHLVKTDYQDTHYNLKFSYPHRIITVSPV